MREKREVLEVLGEGYLVLKRRMGRTLGWGARAGVGDRIGCRVSCDGCDTGEEGEEEGRETHGRWCVYLRGAWGDV